MGVQVEHKTTYKSSHIKTSKPNKTPKSNETYLSNEQLRWNTEDKKMCWMIPQGFNQQNPDRVRVYGQIIQLLQQISCMGKKIV